MSLLKVCLDCGEVTDKPRCELHRPAELPKESSTRRGYDYQWSKLSKRARKMQPFCSDCGTTDDLTADHSPETWDRKQRGLIIRLQDIDVVCRTCNSLRGKARGGEMGPTIRAKDPREKAKFQIDPEAGSGQGVA